MKRIFIALAALAVVALPIGANMVAANATAPSVPVCHAQTPDNQGTPGTFQYQYLFLPPDGAYGHIEHTSDIFPQFTVLNGAHAGTYGPQGDQSLLANGCDTGSETPPPTSPPPVPCEQTEEGCPTTPPTTPPPVVEPAGFIFQTCDQGIFVVVTNGPANIEVMVDGNVVLDVNGANGQYNIGDLPNGSVVELVGPWQTIYLTVDLSCPVVTPIPTPSPVPNPQPGHCALHGLPWPCWHPSWTPNPTGSGSKPALPQNLAFTGLPSAAAAAMPWFVALLIAGTSSILLAKRRSRV